MDKDLNNRLFDFTVAIIHLMRKLNDDEEYKVIKYQLIKSASSSAANYSPCQI